MTLGVLRPPGECGADIAVGEGQPLGNRLDFGGPSFGFFCAHARSTSAGCRAGSPGETDDVDGRRGFVLALQTREQHIRREKATHNICTAQALNALAGDDPPGLARRAGFVELGELLARRTAYARERLAAIDGVELLHDAPVRARVRGAARRARSRCSTALRRARASPPATRSAATTPSTRTACWSRSPSAVDARTSTGLADAARRARSAVSDRAGGRKRRPRRRDPAQPSSAAADADADAPAARARDTIFERSVAGRRAALLPTERAGATPLEELIPAKLLRASRRGCPRSPSRRSSATTTALSRRNFDLDTGFYPLGSCTMKHNPRLNERVAALPGHARLHPAQDPKRAQGALELMWLLQRVAGRDLRPARTSASSPRPARTASSPACC